MDACSLGCQRQLRHGAVAPLTVLCLALLVGVAALVIDGGTLMEARRHVQAAADAAALAGADDLFLNYPVNQGIDSSGTAKASALATAADNGFTNDGIQSLVIVNTSPQPYQGGPNAGRTIPPGYIEVLIQYNVPHLFSGIFGPGTSAVCARAVARGRCVPLQNNGLLALNLNTSNALKVASLGGLTVNGSVQINSSSYLAISTNLAGKVTATQFIFNPAVGVPLENASSSLSGPGGSAPTIITSPPAPDPLRYLSPPPVPLTQYPAQILSGGTWNLYPGLYSGGIQISGTLWNPTKVILHANPDGTPGIYYLSGQTGLRVSGFVTITTDPTEQAGIMIYNDWASTLAAISVNTYNTVAILPPTSGRYRGLSIFQKRGTPSNPGPLLTLNAQSGANVRGTIYAAYASVALATNANNNVMGGQIIADTISTSGSADIFIDPGTQPVANQRILGLVE